MAFDIGMLGGLAGGLEAGTKGFLDSRERRLAQEDRAKQRALQEKLAQFQARKEGYDFNTQTGEAVELPGYQVGTELDIRSKGFQPQKDESGRIIGVGDYDEGFLKAKGAGLEGLLRQTQLQSGLLDVQKKQRELSGKDQKLPAAQVLAVSEGSAVSQVLPDIEQTIKNNADIFGPVKGRVSSANPYDPRAQTIDAQMRNASQSFGRFMEGGVLRKEDEEKYRKMFPQLSDTPEVASNKLMLVQRMLDSRYTQQVGALEKQGFKTEGLVGQTKGAEVPATIRGQQTQGMIPSAQASDVKMINGMQYRKVQGGWQKVK